MNTELINLSDHIEKKFDLFIDSWPKSTSDELKKYFAEYGNRISRTVSNKLLRPYWIFLPHSLVISFKPNKKLSKSEKNILLDIVWAQYSIFLAIRLHDDLYDGQTDIKSVVYAGDKLLIESGELLSKHFSRSSPFWGNYYKLINTTIFAITEADYLQLNPKSSFQKLLDCYQDVCSIFKIGSLAVCSLSNTMAVYYKISQILDKLALAGHMFDDLQDFQEDFANNRFNSFLLYNSKTDINSFTIKDEVNFIDEIKKNILSAEEIAEGLEITALNEILRDWKLYFSNFSKLTENVNMNGDSTYNNQIAFWNS